MIVERHRLAKLLCAIAKEQLGVRVQFHEAERVLTLYRERCMRRKGDTRRDVAQRLYDHLHNELGWPATG